MLTNDELTRVEAVLEARLRKVLSDVEGGGFRDHMQMDCLVDCLRGLDKVQKLKTTA